MFNSNDLNNLDWLSDFPSPITNNSFNESIDFNSFIDDDDDGVVRSGIMSKFLEEIQNYQAEVNGIVMDESIVPSLAYLGGLIGRSKCLMRKFDQLRTEFDHDLEVVYRSIDLVAKLKRAIDALQNFVKENLKNLRILLERKRVNLLGYFGRFRNRRQLPQSNNNNGNNRNGQWNGQNHYSGYSGPHNSSWTSHVCSPPPRPFLLASPAYAFIRPPNPFFLQRQFNLNDLFVLNNLVIMPDSNAWQDSGAANFYPPPANPLGYDALVTIYQFGPEFGPIYVISVICNGTIENF